jgi:hypothetical protein
MTLRERYLGVQMSCVTIGLGIGMAMQGKEMQDMTRLRKSRHGKERQGLGLHAISCYKS